VTTELIDATCEKMPALGDTGGYFLRLSWKVVTGHTIVAQRRVAKDATREELLEAYNQMARGTKTLNATVELKPTAGRSTAVS